VRGPLQATWFDCGTKLAVRAASSAPLAAGESFPPAARVSLRFGEDDYYLGGFVARMIDTCNRALANQPAGRCARCEALEAGPAYIVRGTWTLEEVRAFMDSRPDELRVKYSVPGTSFAVGRRDSDRQGSLDFE